MAYQPKSYRKFLAGSVSAALVATAVGPVVASAASFSDVNPNDSHAANIEKLVEKGYIKGYEDGTFKPYNNVTRGQVAKIFARILKDNGFQVPADKKAFDDVPVDAKDQELVEAAAIVKAAGVMTGNEGKLNPNQTMTRQQMAKVLVEAFDLTKPADFTSKITDLDKADEWARDYIKTLEANGVTVVTEYNPKGTVTRAAFASFVVRALDASSQTTAQDIQGVQYVDQNTLEVTFNGELKDVKKEDFAIEGVEIDSVSIKAAAAEEAKTTVVVIKTKTPLEEGKSYTISYKGQTTDKTKVDVPVVTPKVESVSAINTQEQEVSLTDLPVNGTIKVKFSEKVNKETINVNNLRVFEVKDNVPVSIASSKITLSEDGLTASVDLDGAGLEKGKEYKLEVKNVKSATDKTVDAKTINFTVSKMAVVTNAYFEGSTGDNDNNAPSGVDRINVAFDEKLDASTVTTSNVSLVDLATGKKIPVNLSVTGSTNNEIQITTDNALIDTKQYKLVVENIKTATGEKAEAFSKTFAVNATTPLTDAITVKTLDGKTVGTGLNSVWPKLTSGIQESGNVYHAGLQINVAIAEKLDPSSIESNVQLVEKETKAVVPVTLTYNSDSKILTIVPKADLKEATDYEIQFKGGLKSAEGIYLDPSKKTEVITAESYAFRTLDVTAPTVVEIKSKNGDSGLVVKDAQEFTIKTSEDVVLDNTNVVLVETGVDFNDQASITAKRIAAANLQVTPVLGQKATYTVKVKANALTQNKAYKLVVVGKDMDQTTLVTNGVNSVTVLDDAAGNTLKKSAVYAFTTEGNDVTAPKVVKVYKGNDITDETAVVTNPTNIKSTDKFTFLFDEAIQDGVNIDASKVKLEKYNGSTWVPVTGFSVVPSAVTNKAGDKVGLTVDLNGITINDAKYRLVIGEGTVKDAANNKNTQETVLEFIGTAGDDTAASVEVKVGSVDNSNAFTASTAVDKKIYITFDEDEIFDVAATSVKVTDKDGKEVAGTLKEITQPTDLTSFTGTNKVYEFTPAADLAYDSTYTVTVENVKDIAGNTIAKKVVQFKTVAATKKVVETSIADGAQAVDRQKTIKFKLNATDTLTYNDAVPSATYGDGTTVANGKVTLYKGTTAVAASKVELSNDGVDYSLVLKEALDSNTTYTLKIQTSNKETKVVTFTTGVIATDDVKPKFVEFGQVYDHDGDSGTPDQYVKIGDDLKLTHTVGSNTANLLVQFSEGIDLTGASVAITNVSDDKTVAVLSTTATDRVADANNAKETLSIDPVLDLASGKTYKVVITGVKDASGNVADSVTLYVVGQ
ncbi:Ig-like domain-containing protein [Anoxybacillus rupiensis]|uniref:Ig-like domain-containing protein n=1 Tax=Anoxybacteroides rupiense TaxID=311460 RepID=A0ABT5W683_9BACL|nr:Ig-like domain-containing protein [Anoxybacillus rupiensis]MDE8564817.1 Ig-like domain-containing protein [Anoxybacillus rupiensis]